MSTHPFVPTLLGVPWDASSSFLRGPALAPAAIRDALNSPAGNSWTESLRDLSQPGALDDAGDLSLPTDAARARDTITAGVRALLDRHAIPVVLGGDHSITYPVIRAIRERHARLTILQFDAHPDLYDEFEGDRFSHACPFARIMEEGLADHLIQVGIRASTGHGAEQAARFGVETITAAQFHAGRRPEPTGPLYISFDLDAIDPGATPGVSHQEPGGLSLRDVLAVIQGLQVPVIGADIVELNPTVDLNGMTARVASKLVREIIDAILRAGANR